MIRWYWIIVAVFVTNLVTALVNEQFELDYWWKEIISAIVLVIVFIPTMFYKIFLRLVIFPVSTTRFEDMQKNWVEEDTSKVYHVFRNIYLWIDPDAKKYWNRIFFLRVKDIDKADEV